MHNLFYKQNFLFLALFIFNSHWAFSQKSVYPLKGISILKQAYPDIKFSYQYEESVNDWRITMSIPGHRENEVLYWCDGKMLPKEEIPLKDNYSPILYTLHPLKDPAEMTEEQKKLLKEYSSSSNRKNGTGASMYFFDAVYDSSNRGNLERRIKRVSFLGKPTTVHQRIVEPLSKVEKKIKQAAKTDPEVKKFVTSIKSTDSYYWRIISGTNRKSFHSLGIAMDILPKRMYGKEIFWSWAKDKNPEGWMLTPLSKRWMPPEKIIEIFEEEGFIWGGKWPIWDNMHFEYHPEILIYSGKTNLPKLYGKTLNF